MCHAHISCKTIWKDTSRPNIDSRPQKKLRLPTLSPATWQLNTFIHRNSPMNIQGGLLTWFPRNATIFLQFANRWTRAAANQPESSHFPDLQCVPTTFQMIFFHNTRDFRLILNMPTTPSTFVSSTASFGWSYFIEASPWMYGWLEAYASNPTLYSWAN